MRCYRDRIENGKTFYCLNTHVTMKSSSFHSYSGVFVFDSGMHGPTVVVFWGIHGNEIAWVQVVTKLKGMLEDESIKISTWRIILAYGNEEAILVWKKQIRHNLNRLFREEVIGSSAWESDYEMRRAKELSHVLRESDYLLDLHSVSSESVPFIFANNTPEELGIVSQLWCAKTIVWWSEASGSEVISGDTDSYIHSLGKVGFTLECWNHLSSEASDYWFEKTLLFLETLGVVFSSPSQGRFFSEKQEVFRMDEVILTKTGDFRFAKNIRNFQPVEKWETVWYDWDEPVQATTNFVILLPNFEKTRPQEEIFYRWTVLTQLQHA